MSTSADENLDFDHFAFFIHTALGVTLDMPGQPRFVLQYDYASGDADPEDSKNGRFDTLFGARRFEWGPTGLYGALGRSNINSPGARVELRPHVKFDGNLGYRAAWLAQSRDAWIASAIRDSAGVSGNFIGHQLEAQLRWHPLPGNVTLDTGFTYTFLGDFAKGAPNATSDRNPIYFYTQIGFEI